MKLNRNDALQELAKTALRAVSHVGYANYAEREVEANKWIREKLNELIGAPTLSSHHGATHD